MRFSRTDKRFARGALLTTVLAVICAPVALGATRIPDDRSSTPLTIAVIGDTPDGQPQVDNFPNDVTEINADPLVLRRCPFARDRGIAAQTGVAASLADGVDS